MSDVTVEPASEPRRRSPLVPVVAALAVIGLVVGGIVIASDDDGGGGEAVALLSAAPDAAAEAGTARMAMTTTVSGGGMNLSMDGEGAIDFASGAQLFSMSMMGIDIEMRIVDQIMYLRLPDAARPPGVGTEWIGVPVETTDAAVDNPLTSLQSGAGWLDALRGMSSDVEELGNEEINGQDATGYRVTIDMAEAMEQLPEDRRASARAALDQMAAMGMEQWPMDVWISDDGLPVRMAMELSLPGAEPGEASMSMQLDFVDFGADIDIEAPPADQVTQLPGAAEMNELFGASGATLG